MTEPAERQRCAWPQQCGRIWCTCEGDIAASIVLLAETEQRAAEQSRAYRRQLRALRAGRRPDIEAAAVSGIGAQPVSHAQFAELAARMAAHAAMWAADCLRLKDGLDAPMRPEAVKRFTDQMTSWLEACNGR